jgi:hypothetical protein
LQDGWVDVILKRRSARKTQDLCTEVDTKYAFVAMSHVMDLWQTVVIIRFWFMRWFQVDVGVLLGECTCLETISIRTSQLVFEAFRSFVFSARNRRSRSFPPVFLIFGGSSETRV